MTNTIPQSQLRERTKSSIADLLTEIQDAAREELQTLRRLVDERVAVLERAFARDQDDSAFDQIVQKLCDVAADHAAAASAQARAEAEEVAARELATARELAQADLDAVRAESAATLRLSESIRADLEHRLAHADAAAAESARALSDLRSQSEAACVAFEQRIAHAETARLEAVRARADAERIAAAARHDREVGAVSLDEARARIDTLEGELEASRERALQAKTHAEASRLELQRAADRIRVLEELYRQLDFRPPRSSPDALSAEVGAAVDHVKAALQTLTAAHGGGLIDALLASVAERFSRVVLCVVGPWGGVVLGSCGFKPPLQPQTALQVTTDSLLWRACADGRPTMLQGRDGQALSPFSGRPIVCGIAVPIATEQQSTAVLYA